MSELCTTTVCLAAMGISQLCISANCVRAERWETHDVICKDAQKHEIDYKKNVGNWIVARHLFEIFFSSRIIISRDGSYVQCSILCLKPFWTTFCQFLYYAWSFYEAMWNICTFINSCHTADQSFPDVGRRHTVHFILIVAGKSLSSRILIGHLRLIFRKTGKHFIMEWLF